MHESQARILVVDDLEVNRTVVAAQLKSEGYDILTAEDGEQALALIGHTLPDLIVLDAMMPGISGFEVAQTLKREERTANIPIIMLTALSDSDSRITALSNGAEEFLTKPVARVELLARVRNLLKLKKFQDALADYSNTLEARVAERTAELESANRQLSETQTKLLQSEKLASIGQLAAGVAHEINNPIGFVNSNLGTLKGYLDKLFEVINAYAACETTLSGEVEVLAELKRVKEEIELDYLVMDAPILVAESIEGVSRVRKIVQDLKIFSRSDSGQEWQFANLHDCLDSTLNIATNEIKYRAAVVKEYGELPDVECLPSQLNQVFLNLMVNAAHSIPENLRGTITLRTVRSGDDEVRVEISDTGCGIPEEIRQRIFEPFFTTKPVGKGTGLGLSLSYGIIERHNGQIEVESVVGEGTTFRIRLPVRHVPRQ